MKADGVSWEARLQSWALIAARVGLAYLFFSQLFWKLPPDFGCPPDYSFTTATAQGQLARTTGLCDWLGVQSVWAERSRPMFVTNLDNQGAPELYVDMNWATRINGWFLQNLFMPHIVVTGWLVFLAEAFIAASLFLGLLGRLGGLVALGVSVQLMLGLAGITDPYEWEWTYHLLVLLSLMLSAFPAGRVLGIDALWRPRLTRAAKQGNPLARVLLPLT